MACSSSTALLPEGTVKTLGAQEVPLWAYFQRSTRCTCQAPLEIRSCVLGPNFWSSLRKEDWIQTWMFLSMPVDMMPV